MAQDVHPGGVVPFTLFTEQMIDETCMIVGVGFLITKTNLFSYFFTRALDSSKPKACCVDGVSGARN